MGLIRDLLRPAGTPDRLAREAVREVERNVAGATTNGVPYAELGRHGKLELLSAAIDWDAYVRRGLPPDLPPVVMLNAVDGKPPGQWLEQSPQEAAARAAEMAGYDREFEAAVQRIRASIAERKAAEPAVVRGR